MADVVRFETRGSLPTRTVCTAVVACGEQRDRPLEVVEPSLEVVNGRLRGSHQKMAVDEHVGIVLNVAEGEDLAGQPRRLIELSPEEVEAGQPTQHGVLLLHVRAPFEQVQDTGERRLDLGGEALRRHECPGEARP